MRLHLLRLLTFLPLFCLLCSCGGNDQPVAAPTSARPLAVSLDSANSSLFFTGLATTSGKFESDYPFSLWFSLSANPDSARNDAARFLLDNHGTQITQRASFRPTSNDEGQITLLNGRLILRGKSKGNGSELEGIWYFDGLPGGTFWIRP